MTIPARFVAALRAIAAVFLFATALYGVVAFSPFGYDQFLRPHSITWLIWSAVYHDALALGVFSLTLISLAPDLERRSTMMPALAFIVVGALVTATDFARPVFESLGPGALSLEVTAVAMCLAIWLAVIDHIASTRAVFTAFGDDSTEEPRLFAAAFGTALYVFAAYACVSLYRVSANLETSGLSWLALARSLLLHLLAFAGLAWLLACASGLARLGRRARATEYLLALGVFAAWLFILMRRLVLPALDLSGPVAWALASGFAVAVTASWSGVALRLASADPRSSSGFEIFARPALPSTSRRPLLAWLVVLPLLAGAALWASDRLEWPFVLQKTLVLSVWLSAWAAMLMLARGTPRPSRRVALGVSVVLLAIFAGGRLFDMASSRSERGRRLQVFDRYAALDPSFTTIDDAVAKRPSMSPAFFRFLKANSGVAADIPIPPTPIEFTPRLTPASVRPPNVFLIVIDSLRPDYLAAYNPAVTFTPAIAALARDSLVFRNAFTRYGGTGLSVPAIWAGAVLPHRTYVTPFGPMNALLKLLDANNYRVAVSFDTIMRELLPRTPGLIELGAESWTARDDACRVLSELEQLLDRPGGAAAPLFAYSLPQNVHIGNVQGHPSTGETYPGFYSLLAATVRHVDGCVGRFVEHLKARGVYDDSVIIITADHGDAIGEGGRWGHGFAGFPEIVRIPLIVHLPPRFVQRWSADLDGVSFSTDIVPTLYRLLDQEVTLHGPTFGMPLVYPRDADPPPDRRRGAFLLAASYGPVYGMLQRNGESYYVVDAVNSRDYAFNLAGGPPHATPVPVTPAERLAGQRLIREQIEQVAAFFHFDAQPLR